MTFSYDTCISHKEEVVSPALSLEGDISKPLGLGGHLLDLAVGCVVGMKGSVLHCCGAGLNGMGSAPAEGVLGPAIPASLLGRVN